MEVVVWLAGPCSVGRTWIECVPCQTCTLVSMNRGVPSKRLLLYGIMQRSIKPRRDLCDLREPFHLGDPCDLRSMFISSKFLKAAKSTPPRPSCLRAFAMQRRDLVFPHTCGSSWEHSACNLEDQIKHKVGPIYHILSPP